MEESQHTLRGDAVRSLLAHSSVNTEPLRVFPTLTLPCYRNVGFSSLQCYCTFLELSSPVISAPQTTRSKNKRPGHVAPRWASDCAERELTGLATVRPPTRGARSAASPGANTTWCTFCPQPSPGSGVQILCFQSNIRD